MRQQLKAYYLQQMGIERWVRRSLIAPESFFHIVTPKQGQSEVMVVLEEYEFEKAEQWLSGNVGRLLKKMLSSIGLSTDNTALLCAVYSNGESLVENRDALLKEQVIRFRPKLILVLGQFLSTYLHSCDLSIPLVLSAHPLDLLNNPIKKKLAFIDLLKVKQIMKSEH